MIRKIYRKLTKEQKSRGVIFSSALSITIEGDDNMIIHEITEKDMTEDEEMAENKIKRLKDDRFFNNSIYNYNIIRT